MIWDISTAIPLPTFAGLEIFFSKFKIGINTRSKKVKRLRYFPDNRDLYGESFE